MDDSRFDAMTETISEASSRRIVFAALLGGALAAAGADTLAQELGVAVLDEQAFLKLLGL